MLRIRKPGRLSRSQALPVGKSWQSFISKGQQTGGGSRYKAQGSNLETLPVLVGMVLGRPKLI